VSRKLAARLPTRAEALPVFSIFVFLIYSWALYRMFWYMPSWLEYLSIGSILIIAAYTLGFALIESVVMMGAALFLCLIFPARLFRQQFVAQGSALALALGAGAYLVQRQVSMIYDWKVWQVYAGIGAVLAAMIILILVTAWLFRRFSRLPHLLCAFAERMTIFAVLYIPLGVIGLVVVIIRNL
jgi:hypothetical protein